MQIAIGLVLLDLTPIHTTVNHFTTKGSQMTVKSSKPLLRKIIVNQVKTNVAMMENDRFDGRKHLVNIGIIGC